MKVKILLLIFAMWQIVTAQESCPGPKITTGIGSLLGDIPISNCAPDLPSLPELPSSGDYISGGLPSLPNLPFGLTLPSLPSDVPILPGLPCGCPSLPGLPCGCPSLPSLPYDCPNLPSLPYGDDFPFPSLPDLPPLADFNDYPSFGQPLPYVKKKGCGCSSRSASLKPKSCGCGLARCKLKQSCSKENENTGVGLRIVPLIKKFKLKKPQNCDCTGGLPSELSSFVSLFEGC